MKPAAKLALALAGVGAAAAVFDRLESGRGMRRQLWGLNQRHALEFERKLKARKLPAVDPRILGSANDSLPPPADISPPGGFVASGTRVTLSAPPGKTIRYTLDGSIPDRHSDVYVDPIAIDSSSVVRARVLERGLLPGPIATRAYLTGQRPSIPAVSVVVDPVNLWNKYSGIHANPLQSGEAWTRQAELERLDSAGRVVWASPALIRIHGGYSRHHPKKSFRVSFRAGPGDTAHHTVVLRSGGSNSRHRLRDELFSALYRGSGGIASDFEPVALFLNARPWGIYDAREYVDARFLERRFGSGRYELLAFDSKHRNRWATPSVGDDRHWKATLRFFREAPSLAEPEAYARAERLLDVPGTIDYWAHNIYAANADWPYNNMTVFRRAPGPPSEPGRAEPDSGGGAPEIADGRWRWIAWDADAAFNYRGGKLEHRTLEWAIRDRVRNDLKHNYLKGQFEDEKTFLISTLFMRRLLENPTFKAAFTARFVDLLNVRFRPRKVEALLDSIVALSRADLRADWARWNLSDSSYAADQALIRAFIQKRPAVVRSHLDRVFALPPGRPVAVAFDTTAGSVMVNALDLGASPWEGNYPEGSRLRFEARPRPDHAFAGWRLADGLRKDPVLDVLLAADLRVEAVFAPAPVSAGSQSSGKAAAEPPEARNSGRSAGGAYGIFPPAGL